MCVRDRKSYEFAKTWFDNGNIYLVPDMALSYTFDDYVKVDVGKKVGYCLRKDREYLRSETTEYKLKVFLQGQDYRAVNLSTMSLIRIPSFRRCKTVQRRLKSFSSCSLIVTDRLHGMIFSYITRTPCIFMDNKTRKISGVYHEWLADVDWICEMKGNENWDDVVTFVETLKNMKNLEPSHRIHFNVLKEIINNG